MGHMCHHAIVVTGWDREVTEKAHQSATDIFGESVSGIVGSQVNGYYSFLVGPDGSKSGWKDDIDGDDRRNKFITVLDEIGYRVDYAELYYGEDDGNAGIVRHSGNNDQE